MVGLAISGDLGREVTGIVRGPRAVLSRLVQSSSGKVRIETVDIRDPASCLALRESLAGEVFDLLLVNAGVSGAQGKANAGWQALRGSLTKAAPDSRVAVRLLWERSLADVEVRVQVVKPGVVRLQGSVTAEQRRRAIEVAESTQGVEKVLDELEIRQP